MIPIQNERLDSAVLFWCDNLKLKCYNKKIIISYFLNQAVSKVNVNLFPDKDIASNYSIKWSMPPYFPKDGYI